MLGCMWRGSVELHPLNLIDLLTYQAQTGQDKPLRWGPASWVREELNTNGLQKCRPQTGRREEGVS